MDMRAADPVSVRRAPLEEQVERLLACPVCHSALVVQGAEIRCQGPTCAFRGAIGHGVVLVGDRTNASFFDDRHEVMRQGNEGDGVRCLCYDLQEQVLKRYLRPDSVIVDVGCGPALPYERTSDAFIIGVEPSFESIRANEGVDLRIYGTAGALPLSDCSVDAVVCLYSIHHMVGSSREANLNLVQSALREFGRVVRPGGEVLVFEIQPWRAFWMAEQIAWNPARRVLGRKLDMHFWWGAVLDRLMKLAWPLAAFERQTFDAPLLTMFPPVFSMPWLKVPRVLYPFTPVLLRWKF